MTLTTPPVEQLICIASSPHVGTERKQTQADYAQCCILITVYSNLLQALVDCIFYCIYLFIYLCLADKIRLSIRILKALFNYLVIIF